MSDKVICTKSKITAIANKIRSKLSSQDTYTLDEMPSAIESISGGGTTRPSVDDDVVLFDYDGTVLCSYSKTDFLALSSLPQPPSHTDKQLVFDGWNWTLSNAQTYLSSNGYNMPILCVGAVYHYSGTDTKLVIELIGNNSPYLSLGVNGTVTIDWGDNTSTDTVTGSSATNYQRTLHEYANNGTYTISITPSSDTTYSLGNSSNRIIMSKASGNKADSDLSYMNILKKVYVGKGVPRIYNNSFRDNFGLEEVYFGDEVRYVETETFNKCLALNKITLNEGFLEFQSNNHFIWCNSLKYISIPRSVENIPHMSYCRSLEYIAISDSATGASAQYNFQQDFKLKKLTLPATFTGLINYMFRDCWGLKYIMCPNYSKIWHDCFEGCSTFSLNTLEDNKVIEPNTFSEIQGSDHYFNCYSLESIVLSNNRTAIPDSEFRYCYCLKEIDLTNIVTIGSSAFDSCQSLTNVTLGNNLTTINSKAFYGCRALSKITIPENVTTIGSEAFRDCTDLQSITFEPTTPPTVGNSNAWTNLPTTCIIYVPSGTLSDYTSASNYPSSSTYTYIEY